jgi:adenylosuccinate lyase
VPSHVIDFELFGGQFAASKMRALFDERAMIQRWRDVEAALAAGQAELGIIPAAAADAIARGARVERLDLDAVKRDLAATAELDRLLDPAAYTGLAGAFVDRVLGDTGRLRS